MNVSITNACNRRCKYCFQKDWYLSKKAGCNGPDDTVLEMSVEEFEHLCKWSGNLKTLKLLGGEPLLHSDIISILEVARVYCKDIVLISNISVDPFIFNDIYLSIKKDSSPVKSVLINTDYPESQRQVFLENFSKLCQTSVGLALSTTIIPGRKNVKDSANRIKELGTIFAKSRGDLSLLRIRLAPFCPSPNLSSSYQIRDFTDDIVFFINSLSAEGFSQFGFDCPVNLCELSSDFVDNCRLLNIRIRTERCSPESGMPFDILVDHSIIWCSSANFIRLPDWRKYLNFGAARYALSKEYYNWWRNHGESLKCKICKNHGPGFCSGFCIAKTNKLINTESIIRFSN